MWLGLIAKNLKRFLTNFRTLKLHIICLDLTVVGPVYSSKRDSGKLCKLLSVIVMYRVNNSRRLEKSHRHISIRMLLNWIRRMKLPLSVSASAKSASIRRELIRSFRHTKVSGSPAFWLMMEQRNKRRFRLKPMRSLRDCSKRSRGQSRQIKPI